MLGGGGKKSMDGRGGGGDDIVLSKMEAMMAITGGRETYYSYFLSLSSSLIPALDIFDMTPEMPMAIMAMRLVSYEITMS